MCSVSITRALVASRAVSETGTPRAAVPAPLGAPGVPCAGRSSLCARPAELYWGILLPLPLKSQKSQPCIWGPWCSELLSNNQHQKENQVLNTKRYWISGHTRGLWMLCCTSSPAAPFRIWAVMLWPCGPGRFLYFFLFWHLVTALSVLSNTVDNSTEDKNCLKLKNILKKEEIVFWLRCLPVHINSGQSLHPYKILMVFSAGRLTRHWIPHSGNVWLHDVFIIKFISLECNRASPWLIAQDSCMFRIMPVESNRLMTWFRTYLKRLIDLNIS